MGNKKSKFSDELTDEQLQAAVDRIRVEREEIHTLSRMTKFSTEMIELLHDIFKKISAYSVDDLLIDDDEFAQALGLTPENFFMRRIFEKFKVTRARGMNFREFILACSVLSKHGRTEDKIKFSFGVYDVNGDNSIDFSELKTLLVSAVSNPSCDVQLTEDEVEQIVASTMQQMDLDGNGSIEYDEYKEIVMRNPRLLEPFTLDLDHLLTRTLRIQSAVTYFSSDDEERSSSPLSSPPYIDSPTRIKPKSLQDSSAIHKRDTQRKKWFKRRKSRQTVGKIGKVVAVDDIDSLFI